MDDRAADHWQQQHDDIECVCALDEHQLERGHDECWVSRVRCCHHEFDHFRALDLDFADVLVLCPDNALLVDLFQVLNTQASAAGGTLVANNAALCFSASVSWSRRNDSYLEYNLASV